MKKSEIAGIKVRNQEACLYNNVQGVSKMHNAGFNKMNEILTKMKSDKMKANKREKMKKDFDAASATAGDLDKLIDYWFNNKNNGTDKNILVLDSLSYYYELTEKQEDKIDAPIIVGKLTGEYDGDISEYI